jgi:Protein of unknown function (DUF3306)
MSEQEKFLGRWSRCKQKAAKLAKETAADESKSVQAESVAVDENLAVEKKVDRSALRGEPTKKTPEVFDVKSLPSIDSIVATTDIRPFLAPGVPVELTRAALQKAWRSDPAIRDFVGLSENSWDFNDPNSMHGFGPLQLTDEMKQIVTQMLGFSRTSDSDQVEKAQKPDELGETGGPKTASAVQNPAKEGREPARIVDVKSGDEKNILSHNNISASQRASYDDVATQRELGLHEKNDLKSKGRHGGALPRKRPTAQT